MYDLEDAIAARHSTRLFLRGRPVPTALVTEALELAVRAPSNSNIQPWRVVFASGPARDRLVEALLADADAGAPKVPPLPEEFDHFRRDLGALVYGTMGVPRHDAEARRIAVRRNWEFFRAPLAGIVCIHRDLDFVDALGVGMFLQTFMLALTPAAWVLACRCRSRATRTPSGSNSASATTPGSCAVWRSATRTRTFPPTRSTSPAIRSNTTSSSSRTDGPRGTKHGHGAAA
jgi:nitroreductase